MYRQAQRHVQRRKTMKIHTIRQKQNFTTLHSQRIEYMKQEGNNTTKLKDVETIPKDAVMLTVLVQTEEDINKSDNKQTERMLIA